MSNLIKETIKKKEKERKKRTSLRLFVLKIVGNEIVEEWKTRIEFNYYILYFSCTYYTGTIYL